MDVPVAPAEYPVGRERFSFRVEGRRVLAVNPCVRQSPPVIKAEGRDSSANQTKREVPMKRPGIQDPPFSRRFSMRLVPSAATGRHHRSRGRKDALTDLPTQLPAESVPSRTSVIDLPIPGHENGQ